MTQYGRASAPHQPPPSVRLTIRLLYGVIALGVVSLVVSFFLRDAVTAAVAGNGGLGEGFAQTATTIGLVLRSVGTVAAIVLYVVLAIFTGRGHGWARIVLTVVAALAVLIALLSLGNLALSGAVGAPAVEPPAYSAITSALSLALWVAIGVLLWRPASSAFFAAAGAARARPGRPAR